jgi:hypothetical protein
MRVLSIRLQTATIALVLTPFDRMEKTGIRG